jgi:hypothetical protein
MIGYVWVLPMVAIRDTGRSGEHNLEEYQAYKKNYGYDENDDTKTGTTSSLAANP